MSNKSEKSARLIITGTAVICFLPYLVVMLFPAQLHHVVKPTTYLLFHNIVEFFSIMVSLSIFGVGWHTYSQSRDRHALFLSAAFLTIGLLDFMHTLGNAAMPPFVTGNSSNKSIQFWIAARLFSALAFLISAFIYSEKKPRWLPAATLSRSGLGAIVVFIPAFVFAGITFFPSQMPNMFIPGVGLTTFKIYSEYLIILFLVLAAAAYWRRMTRTGDRLLLYYVAAFVVCIFSELVFAGYTSVFDTFNILGHIYKVAAFFLIYKGIFVASVRNPYREIIVANQQLDAEVAERTRAEQALQRSKGELELRVRERTAELAETNSQLQVELKERKNAEMSLRESEQRWATTLSSIGDAVIATDGTGRITFMNTVAEELTGWVLSEAGAKPVTEVFNIINEQTRTAVDDPVAKVLREGMIVGLANHTTLVRKDGTEVSIDDSGAPIRDSDGNIMGVVLVFRDITGRRRDEAILRDSKTRLDLALKSAEMGAWYWDIPEDRRYFDDQVCRLLGIDPTAFTGSAKEFFDAVHPEDRVTLHEALSLTVEQDLPYEPEYRAVWPDGTNHHIAARGRLVRDDAGRPSRINGIIWDITARKQMDEALRESEAKLHAALASMTDAVFISDAEGRFVEFNDAFATFHRFRNRDECLTTLIEYPNVMDVFLPDGTLAPLHMWAVPRALRGETATNSEYTLRRKDTGETWVGRYAFAPIRDQGGSIVGSVVVGRDVTDRKRAEEEVRKARDELELRVRERTEELRDANAYNRSLIEAALDPLVTIDPRGRISDVNAATEHATGYSRDELIGTDFSDYFTDSDKARAGYRKVFNEGAVHNYPLELRHRDGHATPVLYNASVYRDESGEVIGVFAAARDISEQQRLEAQLRQSQKMEALGTLTGGIAHDFNNILAAVIGFAEIGEEKVTGNQDATRALKRIFEAGIRGRELVKQMLTFSRKTEQEKKPLLLSSIVKETAKLLRASTPTTISIKVDVKSESGLVLADPVQIQQVLMNLCTNAAYAMREKGGILEIELTDFSHRGGNGKSGEIPAGIYMRLTVRDTGVGIPAEIMDRIYDPFFTTKKLGEGTGLGLSVVHGIVKQHDGLITVESEIATGSTFTVYLPKFEEMRPADEAVDETIPTGDERVLFVDDEEPLAEMGEELLSKLGYRVTIKTSSTEALALLKADPTQFDVLITDQTMPDMTGIQLAREVLALRPDMPIIMCTGFSHLVDAETARRAGIKAFTLKPVTKREIGRTVRKVLDE
jgi:PAS domain S-box-containing protein